MDDSGQLFSLDALSPKIPSIIVAINGQGPTRRRLMDMGLTPGAQVTIEGTFEVTMIPLYVVFRNIGWIDSHWGLIIPGAANAFGIFFMRQNIATIPDELMDAARVDGCSEFRIFFNMILPIAKPAMGSLSIIFFMNSWNNFLWPLILLQRPEMMTVTVALRSLQDPIRTPFDQIMAGSTLSTLPLIIAFMLLQRHFIAGITAGAIKG